MDHEGQFKFNLKGLFIAITIYVASLFILGELIEPGFGSERVSFLSHVSFRPEDAVPLGLLFHRVTIGVTLLIMAVSEVSARLMRPATTEVHLSGPQDDFVVENNIPFSSLNLSIMIGIIVIIVRDVVFNSYGAQGVPISAVLATLLVSNKKARKHILLRLRQKIDSLAIGSNNSVHPAVSVALVELRGQVQDSPPRHNVPQIYMTPQ